MKDLLLTFLAAGTALAGIEGCAQIKKPAAQVRAVPAGVRFDQVGQVSLYAGEPCTPQIMFDFHATRFNGFSRGTDARNENPHRRGKQKPARSRFGKMATRRRIERAATFKSRARS